MTARFRAAVAIVGALLAATCFPAAANAAPSVKTYANCTAVHRDYSGGIARKGVRYNVVGSANRPLKGHVKFDTALYDANRKSDRDHDGIACELS